MPEQRNLILAIVLSVTIIVAFQYFYELPRIKETQRQEAVRSEQTVATPGQPDAPPGTAAQSDVVAPGVSAPTAESVAGATSAQTRADVVAGSDRIAIDNGRLKGSIPLLSGRIDDLVLTDYRKTPAPASDFVQLLNPVGTPSTYFAEFGWGASAGEIDLPGRDTQWVASSRELGAEQSVTLEWTNAQGIRFERTIGLDSDYMFTVTRRVTNDGDEPLTLYPYGLISRWETPATLGFYILHEGPIGVLAGTLEEIDYDDLRDDGPIKLESKGGWLGITDKFWLTSLVPDQESDINATFQFTPVGAQDRYQVDFIRPPMAIAPGQTIEVVDRLFAGAKEVELLDRYETEYGIPLFDRAVDFGWFYFLTKPFFYIIHYIYDYVGNYGVAILIFTLLVKAVFYPLANKSYRAMSKMKKLQPEMMRMREQFGDDKMRMNQELMALYKNEKVNPMSGCLPIIVQIPVFFALYKVLFVSIEMRHAPFFGWIHDLSAPDPTSIFNLFGLLPFDPPSFLMIGVWPLLMGATMFLQQRLNPQPADPVQAKVMMFLPLMFIFLFATFPAGLVIYWTWNNILSIAQQWVIMKRMGVSA